MRNIVLLDEEYFSVDGIPFARIYQPLKQGSKSIGLFNVFDSTQAIFQSVEYTDLSFTVDETIAESQAQAMLVLLSICYKPLVVQGDTSLDPNQGGNGGNGGSSLAVSDLVGGEVIENVTGIGINGFTVVDEGSGDVTLSPTDDLVGAKVLNDLGDVDIQDGGMYFGAPVPDGNETRGLRNFVIGLGGGDGIGDDNVAIGNFTLNGTGTDGGNNNDRNVAIGENAGGDLSGGQNNIFLGYDSARNLRSSSNNVIIGSSIEGGNILSNSTLIGNQAGGITNASFFTAIGHFAGNGNLGANCTFVGSFSGRDSSGTNNTSMGLGSLRNNVGSGVFGAGYLSGENNSGGGSSFVGEQAGRFNSGVRANSIGSFSSFQNSGNNCSFFGYNAGRQNSGNNVLALGEGSGFGNAKDLAFIIANTSIPSYTNASDATADLTIANGCVTGNTYIYRNISNGTIGFINP